MELIRFLEISGTTLTIIGATFLTIPKTIGLIFLSLAAISWMIYFYITTQNFLLFQNLFLLLLNLIGIYNWIRKGIN